MAQDSRSVPKALSHRPRDNEVASSLLAGLALCCRPQELPPLSSQTLLEDGLARSTCSISAGDRGQLGLS